MPDARDDDGPIFTVSAFHGGLRERGFVIYPGKRTTADSFRIGCIGQLDDGDMRAVVDAVKDILAGMSIATPLR